jgi:molecular chaperone Hsp33
VRDLQKRHRISAHATQGLGEAVVGALLIASYCKQRERVNVNIQGNGAFSQALVDAYPDGAVRGYIIERENVDYSKFTHDFGIWGGGLLSVLRTKEAEDRPYIGTVPLLTGHLAKDLTFYWYQSEQIPSAVGLGVYVEDGEVQAAGGFLVQAMPGAQDDEVRVIQRHIQNLPNLKEVLLKRQPPAFLLSELFRENQFTLVEEKPIYFACQCSRERVERSLALIGADELSSILKEDGRAVVVCDFCSKEYAVEGPELVQLLKRSQAAAKETGK